MHTMFELEEVLKETQAENTVLRERNKALAEEAAAHADERDQAVKQRDNAQRDHLTAEKRCTEKQRKLDDCALAKAALAQERDEARSKLAIVENVANDEHDKLDQAHNIILVMGTFLVGVLSGWC